MYQVMIVDDEEPVLESFSYIMEQGVDSFSLCGKARSGLEAIQMADELKPDLIFMDIQMPGIDGLEAIRQIKENHGGIVFILATAYERFDIAQKAIQLGVLNYLVKPVTKKKIIKELGEARDFLDRQKKKRDLVLKHKDIQTSPADLNESDFVRSLGESLSPEQWEIYKRQFQFKADRGTIYMLESRGEHSIGDKLDLYRQIRDKLLFKYLCFLAFSDDRAIFYFPEEQSLEELYPHLKNLIKTFASSSIRISSGGIYSYDELVLSYSEAMEPYLLEDYSTPAYEMFQIRRILKYLEEGTLSSFKDDVIDYGQSIFTIMSLPVALGKMTALFTLIFQKLGFFEGNQSCSLPFSPSEEIMVLTSQEEWDAWLHHGLERVMNVVVLSEKKERPPLLERAIEHIHSHYREQIYLGSVAEVCGISTSYLSRLFSENIKCSFVDYLNGYRVDRASELLDKGDLTIKEIAYRVGYNDPNYFSKIFRKYKGTSPSERK